ncbi:MAG: carboxypeptidase regulatory-like domain-containing protein [Acidobacteriota bacterium]|nr:carboxypeptidase regulatory-like domain-containing protein [Acidobacteriota bacterium]
MKKLNTNAKGFTIRIILFLFCLACLAPYAHGQRNTISGYIFGLERQPVADIDVELLDEFSRPTARARTNSSGRFSFSGLSAGRYRVRVLPSATNYQEQEQEIEIVNITRQTSPGSSVTSGYENVQRDFYLRVRKDKQPSGRSESIFIQEVSPKAKEIYNRAIDLLDNKKEEKQGLKDLKLAIEIFPDYYDAIERLGNEYIKLQHFEAAEILLSQAVQINPRGYKSWYGLAYAQYSQNKSNKALEAVQKAISLDSSSLNALILEGILYRQTKNYKQAEKQLRKARDLSKDTVPEIHWQLALLYGNNLNRYREAADELELFLKAEPDNKNTENIKKLIKQFREKVENSK